MKSHPYEGISPRVVEVFNSLVSPNDAYHQVHKRRLVRTLQVLIEQDPRGRLLELGGSGVFTLAMKELLPELEIEVTNFDESQETVHEFCPESRGKSASFKAYNINLEWEEIPVESGTYDWVLCCEVIEHMDIDPMFMMSEVNRITKKNGNLLLTTPNITSSRNIDKMLHGVEPYFFMQYHKDRSPYRHNYEYSIHSLMQVVRASGFDGSSWTEDTFEDPITRSIEKLKTIGIDIPHVGDNIFVVAKKTGPVSDRHPRAIYV
jgi:2-polyprenyl-3-methyl-5-hydroxy-6-metoxy-1,4-benzoquinol methylase